MEDLTTSEIAEKWNISRRMVSLLYAKNCIEGVVLKRNIWLLSENAEKLDNPRRVRKWDR